MAPERFTCLDVTAAFGLGAGTKRGVEIFFKAPYREDHNPSLRINPTKDLWRDDPANLGGNAWELVAQLAGVNADDKRAVSQQLREHGLSNGNSNGQKSKKRPVAFNNHPIKCWYEYQDAQGGFLYSVARVEYTENGKRKKEFPVFCKGSWGLKDKNVELVPYHLPELIAADEVWIVEGEQDVDALRALGLTATCNTGGAGKFHPALSKHFRADQRVITIPDNDEPGLKHVRMVAVTLQRKVARLKILQLPGLTEKGADVSDWLAAGGTRADLEALAVTAPEWAPRGTNAEAPGVMRFTKLGDLLNEEEELTVWLVVDHLPMAGDSLLVAKPKVGKSTLARCLSLAVARGDDFLGCKTAQGSVFYLALEEKRGEVRRHFRSMGATKDDPIFIFCATSPDDGLALLREAMKEEKPVLVIVDPLFRFVRVKDSNDYAAVTNALEPLHTLARETGAHVLAVHHLGKGERQGGDAVLGSTALFAAVDTLLLMKRSDKYRTLSSIQRYGADLEEITLDYDPDSRTLSAGLARSEADQAEAETAILEFFSKTDEPVEENVVHEAVEARRAVKLKALRKLVKEGKVGRTGTGKRGDPYLYQKVSSTEVPTYIRVPEYQNPESDLNHSPESTNAGTGLFTGSPSTPETRVPAFSNEKREEFEL